MWKQLLIAAFFAVFDVECDNAICYYTTSARRREGDAKMAPWQIDPFLCTHIIYAFAKLNGTTIEPGLEYDESKRRIIGTYRLLNDLRKSNRNLKILLSVGGDSVGNEPFKWLAYHSDRRVQFAHNVLLFLRKWDLDGLDVAWMYPSYAEKLSVTFLMQDIFTQFKREAIYTGKPRLLLSALMASERMNWYNIRALNKVLDFYNVICFDLWGYWYKSTGFNSPLFNDENYRERPYRRIEFNTKTRNVQWVVKGYLKQGVPKRKMNLIFPTYARTFYRYESNYYGIYGLSPRKSDRTGKYTKSRTSMSYYEICDLLRNSTTAEVYLSVAQRAKYLIEGRLWASYEDPEMMRDKACYVKVNDLGGIGFWSLENDDFTGDFCNQGRFPLIKAAMMEMNHYYLDHCFKESSFKLLKRLKRSTIVCDNGESRRQSHPPGCSHFYRCNHGNDCPMLCPINGLLHSANQSCVQPGSVPECS